MMERQLKRAMAQMAIRWDGEIIAEKACLLSAGLIATLAFGKGGEAGEDGCGALQNDDDVLLHGGDRGCHVCLGSEHVHGGCRLFLVWAVRSERRKRLSRR